MDEDQDKFLDEAISVVKQQATIMQRALDSGNLKEAVKHATSLISELRTSLLSPKHYYELYMTVFDELRYLELFFMEEYRKGKSMAELYETVQHVSNVLPRLYLLITVGSVYIQTRELPAKDILKDLLEMVKGVQHPIRGLFLRYYLNKICKDKLPDKGNEYEGEGGDTNDSIEFILTNLSEMNRLWIRMQHTGHVKDKVKREKERSDLRVTVGENIIRLSNLEGVTLEIYKSHVLPKILETVTTAKDTISQQYLMDCVIQAFSDDYHLNTLAPLLDACTHLQPSVEIKSIFINLMDRLSNYAGDTKEDLEIVNTIDIFSLFKTYIDKIISEQGGTIECKRLLELQVAFLRFSLKCYPMSTDNVNAILDSCVNLISKYTENDTRLDSESLKSIVKLLSFPLETLSLAILSMDNYPKLMKYLQFPSRKQVAFKIVQAVVSSRKQLTDLTVGEQLIEFIMPLLIDTQDSVEAEQYEFEEEQQNVARLLHLIYNSDADTYFEIMQAFKKMFAKGGKKRMKFTYPSLVFALFRFARFLKAYEGETRISLDNIWKMLLEVVGKISGLDCDLGLRLNLQTVLCMNELDPEKQYEEISYEFASQALVIYQDELSDSEHKLIAIKIIAGTFQRLSCFDEDNYDTLITNATQYAAKLLKKPDQCNGVVMCTHMFYNEYMQNERRVVECLKKALKLADICVSNPKNVILFVMILNAYLYYLEKQVSTIEIEDINNLIELAKEHISNVESEGESASDVADAKSYLRNTLKFIATKPEFEGVSRA